MQISVHKENYDAYRERKQIVHNQGVLLKAIDAVSGKGKASKGSDEEDESDKSDAFDVTVPYAQWHSESIKWAAFGGISSPPTSSVHTGEQPSSSRAANEDEDDVEDAAYSEESQDAEDSE